MESISEQLNLLIFICLCLEICHSLEVVRKFKISEDTPPNTSIGYLIDSSVSNSGNGGSANGGGTMLETGKNQGSTSFYIIYPDDSGVEDHFYVNNFSGEIRLKKSLDYEQKSQFVFLAIGSNASPPMRVVIEVVDVNDNAPVFPTKVEEIELSEFAKIGSEIPLPTANDADSGNFGIQRYEIVSGNVNNAFRLTTRSINSQLYVDLVVNSELDREFSETYSIVIQAFDGGVPPLTSTLTLRVRIADANDNSPIFEKDKYTARLDREAPVGTEVLTVKATDEDEGFNGLVEYFLLPSPRESHLHFAIDHSTGTITLQMSIAVDGRQEYELLVMAKDRGTQPLENTVFVIVQIDGGAASSMSISVLYLTSNGAPAIREDAPLESFISRISLTDIETGFEINDAQISLTQPGPIISKGVSNVAGIIEGVNDVPFNLKATEHPGAYVLYLVAPLDRETQPNHTVTLVGFQRSDPDRTVRRNLTIVVLDVNDNPPVFSQDVYETNITELSVSGSTVARIFAFDADTGENGRITYSVSVNSKTGGGTVGKPSSLISDWFTIDPDTGDLSATGRVDCEVNARPEITVVARDNGSPSKSTSARVFISVLDVNDNAPVFGQTEYNASIFENEEVDTCFMQVNATDPDCGFNAEVKYRIVGSGFDTDSFIIKSDGKIYVAKPLDYETKAGYRFAVEAYDPEGLYSTALVRIFVIDINDNAPAFYPSSYNVSLRIDSVPGQPILIVSAEDADAKELGTVTYQLISGNEWGLFRLDSKQGDLYLDQSLQRGGAASYFLKISATDGGGLRSVVPAMITISVLPENYPSPTFEKKRYHFKVREDTLPGIAVGNVKATGNGPVIYSLYAGDPEGLFGIEPSTGTILVMKYLDHDTQEQLLLNVQAMVGDPPAYNHTQVQVYVEDVNDNAPRFEAQQLSLSVREDQLINRVFYKVEAVDADSDGNGRIRYRFAPNSATKGFLINPESSEISLLAPLDYETKKVHHLIIIAEDGGLPSLSSNVTLKISVLDANDNAPVFQKHAYSTALPEDAALSTKVLQVKATDIDSGRNAQISYSIIAQPEPAHFGIYADSGEVFVRRSLDRETVAEYELKIAATDNGAPRLQSTVVLAIDLIDINDNAPNCTGRNVFVVEENQSKNTIVGRIDADDPDLGPNGTVFYSMVETSTHFRIDTASGIIYTLKSLDHEIRRSYQLAVQASDGSSTPRFADCPITINVGDVNDNPPFFILPHTNRILFPEERPSGSEVGQVRATDPDAGLNGTVRYSFFKGSHLPFKLDAETGVISATKILDYEKDPRTYDVSILAEDLGRPPQNIVKLLTIELTDIEDGVASEDEVLVTFEVSETTPIRSKIGKIDPDFKIDSASIEESENIVDDLETLGGGNVDIKYEIFSGNRLGIFEIDQLTATLYLVKPLDYETISLLFLKIRKIDNSAAYRRTSVIQAKIYVQDANDNAPVFAEDPIIFSVPENVGIGQVIWTFNATDTDTGSNGRVKYAIDKQLPEGVFDLDALSGELWAAKSLDYEVIPEYMIVVTATDQATEKSERLITKVTARIYVTDVNDNSPSFSSPARVRMMEDEPIGKAVFHVIARDADWRENGRISYSILEEAKGAEGLFRINRTTGSLELTRVLSRQSPRSLKLVIQAEDNGSPPRSSKQALEILVEDVNDNAPRFLQSIYYANVSENLPPGSRVVQISATMPELGSSSDLIYVFPEKGVGANFKMDQKSGIVETAVKLDRETRDKYVYTVYARESSSPVRYDTAALIIQVTDVNDHAPRFAASSCLPLQIPEDKSFQEFRKMLAVDKDTGLNARITYSIAGGNSDNLFSVDPTNGYLSVDRLDRERQPSYNLTLVALDSGVPGLTNTCHVSVTVSDINDHAPIFQKTEYEAEIPENVPLRTTVLTVNAVDLDEGPLGLVTYSLGNDTRGYFEVDNVTGDITTKRILDYERYQSLKFTVIAYDNGPSVINKGVTTVTIRISDVNDHVPEFDQWLVLANVSSSLAAGKRIVKVGASDKDASSSDNMRVSFRFVEPSPIYFNINRETGVISAKSTTEIPLDASPIIFRVQVSDHGKPRPLASTALVYVQVADEEGNIRNPIQLNDVVTMATLPENVVDGSSVVTIETGGTINLGISKRATRGADMQYSLVSGNALDIYTIDPKSGVIKVKNASLLDAEQMEEHVLVVMGREVQVGGVSGAAIPSIRETFTTVKISLDDVNDNPPEFLQNQYFTSVFEGQPKGTFVMKVSATDNDADSGNSAITYSIVGGNTDGAFMIERDGLVRTSGELDREITGDYRLTVMAADNGRPDIQSGSATVNVRVLDVNDNEPVFPRFVDVELSEATELGSIISVVAANDVDSGPALTYDLAKDRSDVITRPFAMDRFSGRLTLVQPLDYEVWNEHKLLVIVSDGVHEMTADLNVVVLDENDNVPEFTQHFYEVSLPDDTPAGSSVAKVTAVDLDSGDSGKVIYRLTRVTPALQGFYINPKTGELFLNETRPLTTHHNGANGSRLVELTVEASDAGSPSNSAITTINIHIVPNTNLEQPRFEQRAYVFEIPEDMVIHSTIGILSTISPEKRQQVLFSIMSGDNNRTFSIDQSTGQLILEKSIDREVIANYRLLVSVHTKMNSVANSTAQVDINIIDVNDHSPVFQQLQYSKNVGEMLEVGAPVLTVTAVDRDIGDNSKIRYTITSGNEGDVFEIDESSGLIKLKSPLDYEKRTSYKLVVRASDSAPIPRSALTTCIIGLLDENDNGPEFATKIFKIRIPESSPNGSVLFTAKATDKDSGKFGNLTYSILEMGSNLEIRRHFRINSETGDVISAGAFDFEQTTAYSFTIVAIDRGKRSTEVPCQVILKGVDEFAPEFSQNAYIFQTVYSAEIGDIVGVVYADDKDAGLDGQVRYSLKDPNVYFAVHKSTGVITVESPLLALSEKFPKSTSTALTSNTAAARKSRRAITDVVEEGSNVIVNDAQADVPETPPANQKSLEGKSPLVRKVFLTVIAESGPVESPKPAHARVEIELVHQAPTPLSHSRDFKIAILATTAVVIFLLVLLIVLCCCLKSNCYSSSVVICCCCGKKKHRNQKHKKCHPKNKQSLSHYPGCGAGFGGSSGGSGTPITGINGRKPGDPLNQQGLGAKPLPSILNGSHLPSSPGEREPLALADLADNSNSSCGPTKQNSSDPPLPLPRSRGMPSFSNLSNTERSSGHGSVIDSDSGDIIWQQQSVGSGRPSRLETGSRLRSAPDSGIHVMPDDAASLASEYPAAQDYLTSLGVIDSRPYATVSSSSGGAGLGSSSRHLGGTNSEINNIRSASSADGIQNVLNNNPRRAGELGDDDDEDIDIQNMIYSKLSEIEPGALGGGVHLRSGRGRSAISPAVSTAFPSSSGVGDVFNSDSYLAPHSSHPIYEAGGVASWQQLPSRTATSQAPSFQPISSVFSQIGKLDGSSTKDTLKRHNASVAAAMVQQSAKESQSNSSLPPSGATVHGGTLGRKTPSSTGGTMNGGTLTRKRSGENTASSSGGTLGRRSQQMHPSSDHSSFPSQRVITPSTSFTRSLLPNGGHFPNKSVAPVPPSRSATAFPPTPPGDYNSNSSGSHSASYRNQPQSTAFPFPSMNSLYNGTQQQQQQPQQRYSSRHYHPPTSAGGGDGIFDSNRHLSNSPGLQILPNFASPDSPSGKLPGGISNNGASNRQQQNHRHSSYSNNSDVEIKI